MARVVYVRERVERLLAARPATITKANGYATNVAACLRRRGFPHELNSAFEVWLQFGQTEYQHRSTGLLEAVVPMGLTYGVPSESGEPATELNCLRGDLQKASQTSGSFYVPYTSLPLRQIQLHLVSEDYEYTQELKQPLWLGYTVFEVRYCQLIENPALWDSEDTVQTE